MTILLEVKNVFKSFQKGTPAVNDVSFALERGKCLGIVGESGSGKSTLARLIMRIEKRDKGEIFFRGDRLDKLKGERLRQTRRHLQMVFQDPTASLNPRLKIISSLMEPLDNFPEATPFFLQDVRKSRQETAAKLLEMVGLSTDYLERYPHQLSGGQRQRVAIARAISLGPDLVVCDEPTSSLDVSVQAQILNLLKELKESLQMSYLFISHDIAAVHYMSDEMIVMKNGVVVDRCEPGELLTPNRNEYTKALIHACS